MSWMDPFELVDHASSVAFFENSLELAMNTSSQNNVPIPPEERNYCANALALFAMNSPTSLYEDGHNPTLRDYDRLINSRIVPKSGRNQEFLACYLLVITGFYNYQKSSYYPLKQYVRYGQILFHRASLSPEMFLRRTLLVNTAEKFEFWLEIFRQLYGYLAFERYAIPSLVNLDSKPS